MKVGRPTKLSEEARRKIEEIAALDGSVEEMAFYAGIHRATLHRWLTEDKEFSDKVAGLRLNPVLKARRTVVESLSDHNSAYRYLEKKRSKEFGNTLNVNTNINYMSKDAEDAVKGLFEDE